MHGSPGSEERAHGSRLPCLDLPSTANIRNVSPFDNASTPPNAFALQAKRTSQYKHCKFKRRYWVKIHSWLSLK